MTTNTPRDRDDAAELHDLVAKLDLDWYRIGELIESQTPLPDVMLQLVMNLQDLTHAVGKIAEALDTQGGTTR